MAPNNKKNTEKNSSKANKESGKTDTFQKVCAEGEAELMELAKEMSTDLGHLIGYKSGAETAKECLGLSEEEYKSVFGDMEVVDGKIEVLKQKLAELVASTAMLKMLKEFDFNKHSNGGEGGSGGSNGGGMGGGVAV